MFDDDDSPATYYDRRFARDAVKIKPGQYFVTGADKLIVTVLGSCVSACIYDPFEKIGGMNHFLLPASEKVSQLDLSATRYGVHAMEMLINECLKMGAVKSRLQAKVFGGAKVIPGFRYNTIGGINSTFVLEFLQNEGIQVVAQDLLRDYARKIYFLPHNGKVMMKRIKDLNNATIIERESALRNRINHQERLSGSIDLFDI